MGGVRARSRARDAPRADSVARTGTPRSAILKAMRQELASGYRAAGLWQERVGGGLGLEALLLDALKHRMENAVDALFGLTGALHGADWVEVALSRYRSGSARLQAWAWCCFMLCCCLPMLCNRKTAADMAAENNHPDVVALLRGGGMPAETPTAPQRDTSPRTTS